MVVGRQRQRPGAEHAVVVGQQLRGGLRRTEGIEPLVDHVVDAHVLASGGGHELPKTRGADLRVHRRRERRLHVRQGCELRRQAEAREGPRDVRLPRAAAHETGAEPIGLPELEPYAARGLQQALRRDARAPQRAHTLDVGSGSRRCRGLGHGIRAGTRGGLLQGVGVAGTGGIDGVAPQRRGHVGRELQSGVDDREIPLVVQQSLAGRDFGIDADPEVDVPLQLGRARDRRTGGCGHAGRGACERSDPRGKQQHAPEQDASPHDQALHGAPDPAPTPRKKGRPCSRP